MSDNLKDNEALVAIKDGTRVSIRNFFTSGSDSFISGSDFGSSTIFGSSSGSSTTFGLTRIGGSESAATFTTWFARSFRMPPIVSQKSVKN